MNRYLRILRAVLVLLIFAGALSLLYRELEHYRYQDFRRSLGEIPVCRVIAAIGLTVLNYVILIGNDLLAVRYVGHRLPFGKVAMASFIGFVGSYNFGPVLGGSSVRYRLYSAWGLSATEIVQLLTVLALTFWLGMFLLSGIVFVAAPFPVPATLHLPFSSLRGLGIVLLVVGTVYLLLVAARRRPLRILGWDLTLPSLGTSLSQVAVTWADVLVAGAILFVLLPPNLPVTYPGFLGVFLLAELATVTTNVPGGLGVFDLIILVLLAPAEPHRLVASLVVFRAIYYLLPLLLAATLLATHELVSRKEPLARLLAAVGQLAPAAAPGLVALLVFLTGAALLVSGDLPIPPHRLAWARDFLPLPLFELSHFLGSIVGVFLLLLARGLQRRLDSAYWLATVLLAAGVVLSFLRRFGYEEAVFLLAMLGLLAVSRRHFYRKGSLLRQPLTPTWTMATVIVLLCSIWLGLFVYKHVEYSNELWWRFGFETGAPRFLRATAGAVVLLLAFALATLLRPATPRLAVPNGSQWEAVKRIVASSPDTDAQMALLGDKTFLLNDEKTAFVMYAVKGRSWVALGDAVGSPSTRSELAWRFHELCDEYDGWAVFYRVSEDCLSVYLDLGLTLLKLGEEARVPLPTFSLEGASWRGLRHTCSRCRHQNCVLDVVPVQEVPPLLPELRQVSDAWLAKKEAHEKAFSLGYFDEAYLRQCPIAAVRQNGKIVAFANVLCGGGQEELSADLMRYGPDAPNGVMDFLFAELMLWGKQRGYRWFNLGMAPLSGLEDHTLDSLWDRIGLLIFRHGEHFYNFQGLRQYKEKFAPEWRPKYLASPGGLALPRTLIDVARLIGKVASNGR